MESVFPTRRQIDHNPHFALHSLIFELLTTKALGSYISISINCKIYSGYTFVLLIFDY